MNLEELISGLDVRPAAPAGRVRICDVTDDSRTVVPGSLFIARAGTKADGRKFIGDAIAAGAVAVLTDDAAGLEGRAVFLTAPDVPLAAARIAERFYGDPSSKLTLIGVTGTNGKTTTAHLVHQILNDAGVRCGLIGTVLVDDGREVAPATLTTPPAAELSRTMATMVESGCKAAVMEVSSHALDQRRVVALQFDVGVFTNLTGDHLDYHGTMEKYGAAKAILFGMLPADGTAVLNAEDPWADRILGASRARELRCSVVEGESKAKPGACAATIRAMTMQGSRLAFQGPWGSFEADVPLVGRHNAMNALEAVAACHAAGVPMEGLRRAIIAAQAPPGRLEPVTASGPLADPFTVLVDYAHTDDALRKVLTALRPLVPQGGRLAVVFGCGGDRDRTKRPRMGAAAAELADVISVTSDNPRTEEPRSIIEEILEGIPSARRAGMAVDPDRKAAIRRAVERLAPGDVLLIAGKGHEPYQILPDGRGGTTTIHFDDREVARAALADRRRLARTKAAQSATS